MLKKHLKASLFLAFLCMGTCPAESTTTDETIIDEVSIDETPTEPKKLSKFQAWIIMLSGAQPHEATFKKVMANSVILWTMRLAGSLLKAPTPAIYCAQHITLRHLNAHDPLSTSVQKGLQEFLLNGGAEVTAEYFLGTEKYPDLKDKKLRFGPFAAFSNTKKLSGNAVYASAAVSALRAAYLWHTAQQALNQVEEECKSLDIESNIKGGLTPPDDSYLVIQNPLNRLARAATMSINTLSSFQEMPYNVLTEAEEATINTALQPMDQFKQRVSIFKAKNEPILKRNIKSAEKDLSICKLNGMPLALCDMATHYYGRTFIPHETFAKLSPELQEKLVDIAMFNSASTQIRM